MIEVIKLQLGTPSPDLVVRLQVENILDAEAILPLCVEYQQGGASVNVCTILPPFPLFDKS